MKTTIHRDIAMASGCWLAAIAVTVPMLSGCDLFWKPCSDPSADCLMEASDAGPGTMDQAMPSDSPLTTNPRTFEWRAKVTVDPNKQKFVGMSGQFPVFHVKDGQNWECNGDKYWSHWNVPTVALLQTASERRIVDGNLPGRVCSRFLLDRLLLSNKTLYLLDSDDRVVKFADTANAVVAGQKYRDPATYFRFPTTDGAAVVVQPKDGGVKLGVLIRWDAKSANVYESNERAATAIILGDLDDREVVKNGMEALLFQQGTVQTVLHQGANGNPQYTDEELRNGLDAAVQRIGKGQSVGAGFIADVDLDGQTDLVLAFGSSLYVTTYMGRDAAKVGKFRDWPMPIVSVVSGDPIRSVMAVGLTSDGYPELVVETDNAVHFYLNNP